MVPSRRLVAIAGLAALAGCSPRPSAGVAPAPATPEATVGQFIAAVNADSLGRMGELFGDERGPFATYVTNATEREERLAIMQRLLLCDSSRILGWEPVPGAPARRLLQVELKRQERWLPAPFTVAAQRGGGWLVAVIKLDALLPGGAAPGAQQRPQP